MQNIFHSSYNCGPEIIGKACMAAYDAAIMHYSFYDGMGYSCYLGIARKNQFAGDEEAFVCMAMRHHHYNNFPADTDFTAHIESSTEEDFIEDAEQVMVPVYGNAEIQETDTQEFVTQYDNWVDFITSYIRIYENEKVRYRYNDSGIYRNGEEYAGNYQLFDPLRGQHIQKCFLILDQWNRKEHLATCDQYYLFLNLEFHSL